MSKKYRYITFSNADQYRRYVQDGSNGSTDTRPDDVYAETHGSYGGELLKPEWKRKRAEILTRDGHACVICKRTGELQVHHRQYHFLVKEKKFKLPWQYPDYLLITLCESCHSRGHYKYRVPIINI
jgi:5-methylcytosine-specific restriction endonuclease McrA